MQDLTDLERDAFMAQAETLARLINTPEWGAWEELLKRMKDATVDNFAKSPADDLRFWQGCVAMLQEVIDRPHEIVDTARELHDGEEQDNGGPLHIRRSLEMHAGPLVDEV